VLEIELGLECQVARDQWRPSVRVSLLDQEPEGKGVNKVELVVLRVEGKRVGEGGERVSISLGGKVSV
jgi:hypothetical protein